MTSTVPVAEEVAGATQRAADALDDTWGSRFRLLLNGATSALRGFGMELGPILTAAVSAKSFGKGLGLDRLVGKLLPSGVLERIGLDASGSLAKGMIGSVGDRVGTFMKSGLPNILKNAGTV